MAIAFCILTKNNDTIKFLSASEGVITGVVVSGSNITVTVQATGAEWIVVIMRSASFDRWQQTGELWYNYICVEWMSYAGFHSGKRTRGGGRGEAKR